MATFRQAMLPGMRGAVQRNAPPRAQHFSAGATSAGYTGPMSSQLVMGVHDLSDQKVVDYRGVTAPYEVDPHGFVHEGEGAGFSKSIPPHDAVHGFQAARELYDSHGGRFDKTTAQYVEQEGYSSPSHLGWTAGSGAVHNEKVREVRKHWRAQPTVKLPTDTLIHTNQGHLDTEGDAPQTWSPTASAMVTLGPGEGRERIDKIKADLAGKGPAARIRKPAWVVKQGGRFYALDGHHRIVAAREAGLSHVPVKLWDRDKENGVSA